jgi:hypothetical protein
MGLYKRVQRRHSTYFNAPSRHLVTPDSLSLKHSH